MGRGSRIGTGNRSFRRLYGFPYRAGGSYLYPGFDGWLGPGLLSYPGDIGPFDNGAYASPPPSSESYEGQAAGPGDPAPEEQALQGAPTTRMAYQRDSAARPAPEQASEDAVTLVFRDGRAPEQIHNYLLTRTTLYVQDGRHREIPLEQLNLAATQRVNHEAGIDFRVPEESR